MNVRTRPSTRARVSRYAAFATAAGAASTASADVVIVDLVSPAGVGTPINLGEAVGRPPTAFMGVISSQGGGGLLRRRGPFHWLQLFYWAVVWSQFHDQR